jgi:hypothetical protein
MLRLLLRAVAAFTLLGAAVIHAAQAPSHLAQWWAAGVAFVALAAAQAVLGMAAAAGADRRVWLLAQAVSLAAIGLWALSRTVGLPVGPEAGEPEPVGRADLAAVALEAATVLAATLLAWPGARLAGRRPARAATAGVLAVALLTGAVTWSGLQPTSVCDDHDAGQDRLGPLAAVEGHSLLPASTPVATAAVGQRVGLVVGLLRNCATAPLPPPPSPCRPPGCSTRSARATPLSPAGLWSPRCRPPSPAAPCPNVSWSAPSRCPARSPSRPRRIAPPARW